MSIAITRALPQQKAKAKISAPLLRKPIHFFLVFLLLLSSFGLIYLKDLNRRLYNQEQKVESAYNRQANENINLLLEKSTWSTQERIQLLAKRNLDMQIPTAEQTVIIKSKQMS